MHYKDLWGASKQRIFKALSSNWTWASHLGRLTCNSRPLSFTINVYPTLTGCVCPHNPIIPEKYSTIWHVSKVVHTSKALGHALFIPTAICAVQHRRYIQLQGEMLQWGSFSLLGQMAGHLLKLWPVVVSKVWLQWLLWPISLYCSDVRQSQQRVKSPNVAREWMRLIFCHSFHLMNISASQFFIARQVYSCMRTVCEQIVSIYCVPTLI